MPDRHTTVPMSRWRRTACALAFALAASACFAQDTAPEEWHKVGDFDGYAVSINTGSIRRDVGQGEQVWAWVWFEEGMRLPLGHLLMPWRGLRANEASRERVSIDCSTRSYLIRDFENRPHSPRYYGRASEVVPGSAAAAVLAWLCPA